MKTFSMYFLIMLLLVFSCNMLADSNSQEEEKVTVNPYGYIKMDAIYESGYGSHGNYALWAANPGDSDGTFHITANQTRLGLNIKGFSIGKFKATGKVEVDFYGGGAENKSLNFMRHAYLQISDGSLTIIAGQYWDLISPLNPSTLNYPVLWGAGNMGYRRPQLRIRKDIKSGKNVFTIEAGIFRTIAGDLDNDGIDDGTAAGYPSIQGRVAGKFSLGSSASLQIGVSGHYGKTKGDNEYETNSICGDFLLVLSPKFKITAEYFSGKNLGTFLGGIALSVNNAAGVEIKSKGFYVSMDAGLAKNINFSAGYGMDDPDDDTLNGGMRSKNTSIFGNLVFALSGSVKIGFEISNFETDYLYSETQKTLRLQNSWILSF